MLMSDILALAIPVRHVSKENWVICGILLGWTRSNAEEDLVKVSVWSAKTDVSDRTMVEFKYDFGEIRNYLGGHTVV